jgi:spore maturation protein CgeB
MNFGLGKEFQEAGNMRLFETTGSGVFLLNEFMPNIREYFEPGLEVEVFRSEREMLEKIAFYLANPDRREAIARRGRERCLAEHSMECRIPELEAIVHKYIGKKRKAHERETFHG